MTLLSLEEQFSDGVNSLIITVLQSMQRECMGSCTVGAKGWRSSLECLPYGEDQQVLGSRCFQVLDGADSVQTLLQEELS